MQALFSLDLFEERLSLSSLLISLKVKSFWSCSACALSYISCKDSPDFMEEGRRREEGGGWEGVRDEERGGRVDEWKSRWGEGGGGGEGKTWEGKLETLIRGREDEQAGWRGGKEDEQEGERGGRSDEGGEGMEERGGGIEVGEGMRVREEEWRRVDKRGSEEEKDEGGGNVVERGAGGGGWEEKGDEGRWEEGGDRGKKENNEGEEEGGTGKTELKEEFFCEGDLDLIFLRK